MNSKTDTPTALTGTFIQEPKAVWKAAPESIAACLMLGVVTTAGIFYANILPVLVGGLVESLDYSKQQAGNVTAANIYGAALGSLIAVLLVKRLPWKRTVVGALLPLLALDLLSPSIVAAEGLITLRFIAGVFGGLITGTGLAVMARTGKPEISYACMLLIQFGLGGVGLYALPSLTLIYGTKALFFTLAIFDITALLFIVFLAAYPAKNNKNSDSNLDSNANRQRAKTALFPIGLMLVAVFLFQGANNGVYAFVERLGMEVGLSVQWVSLSLGIGAWVGVPGALLVIGIANRYGRLLPLLAVGGLMVAGWWLLHYPAIPQAFLWSGALVSFAWAFIIPYLFGILAELDPSGQMAAYGGLFSKLGLASGPLVGGVVLLDNDYSLLVNLGIAGLVTSLCLAFIPVLQLDRKRTSST